jgi:hypothetical protein
MTRRALPIIFALALAAVIAVASTTVTVRARLLPAVQNPDGVAAIEAYGKQMDAYARRNTGRGRLFADTSDYRDANSPARWREFRSKRALQRSEAYSASTVWSNQAGDPVLAEFSLSSPSGDWAHNVTYYYRDDGTLAKLHSELRTFMGELIVIRDRLYDSKAKLLQEKTTYLDLKTRKPKKVEQGSFMDAPAELYAKTSDLPFYALLKKRQRNHPRSIDILSGTP